MIPLDLLVALAPTVLLACLWLADALLHRSDRRRRLARRQLIKLLSDADRRKAGSVIRSGRAPLPG